MVAEMQNSEKIKENNKMNYTVLNEELGIYACHVGNLTGKEAGKFLGMPSSFCGCGKQSKPRQRRRSIRPGPQCG